jgi:predicted enzyme related to lactoylglutathione lyase
MHRLPPIEPHIVVCFGNSVKDEKRDCSSEVIMSGVNGNVIMSGHGDERTLTMPAYSPLASQFYTETLGFKLEMHPSPSFASLSLRDLQLLLNRPSAGGAGQAMPDGQLPAPGGWNPIQIEVADLEGTVERLKSAGGRLSNEIVTIAAAYFVSWTRIKLSDRYEIELDDTAF